MPIVPGDWSVVILGAWNRAILTPSGISKRLFKLPEGTQVEVHVPIDVMAPFRVTHGEVSVTVTAESLIVVPSEPTFSNLNRAFEIAREALANLPETPVIAAGINLKYQSNTPVQVLTKLVENPIDQALGGQNLEVVTRSLLRTVRWSQGELRIAIGQESDQTYSILLNFHVDADPAGKLTKWRSVSMVEVRRQVYDLLFDCLGLSEEDVCHAEEVDRAFQHLQPAGGDQI